MSLEEINLSKYSSMTIFIYSTESLTKTEKVKFFYALNGRGSKESILKKYNAVHFGTTIILVPKRFEDNFRKFLEYWKIKFNVKEVLIEK